MGLFTKSKKDASYVVVGFVEDGVCSAQIAAPGAARPSVTMATFHGEGKGERQSAFEKAVRELPLARCQCGTVLRSDEYQLLSVEAPNVPAEEMRTAIRWRLKDMLDYHVDDATIDVFDIPADRNAPTRTHQLFAVAARNQVIQKRQELFDAEKLALRVIDIPDMAQRNIARLIETEGRATAMLSFDAEGGLLTISSGGELYLSRRLDVPLLEAPVADSERIAACHERITLELQRSLDHFDRQHQAIPVAKLVLAPLGAHAEALQAYLRSNLYTTVESLDLAAILDLSAVPHLAAAEQQQRFFMTIGAALRHEEAVL